jgi:hypothetical protein
VGKRKGKKRWEPTQRRRRFLSLRAAKEQANAGDAARKYHLHICPRCYENDRVEYVKCTRPGHRRTDYVNPEHSEEIDFVPPEQASFQVYKFCVPHAREETTRLGASPPVEQDVQILLALCAERNISAVDALVVLIEENDVPWKRVISVARRALALQEYAKCVAAGERGFTHKLAKKHGLNSSSLKVWAKRQKKTAAPKRDPV